MAALYQCVKVSRVHGGNLTKVTFLARLKVCELIFLCQPPSSATAERVIFPLAFLDMECYI